MDVDDPGNPEKNSGSVPYSKNVVRTFNLEKSKVKNKLYVGSQALGFRRDHMEVLSPIKDGVVVDWDIVDSIWDHVFRTAELMFEKYKVPALFLAKNAVLTSFASGRATFLVVDRFFDLDLVHYLCSFCFQGKWLLSNVLLFFSII
ncbi:actin-related protein 4-like isoform X3 [Camellia sinensis]|uniref:actin-related protein 4-like isoform X3 n=1 Tax=Camellia sinensis TaxID=4442 RepID=UPI001036596F|nr:actin-related protein 4-like isoform X3 [Camellia sinensis]